LLAWNITLYGLAFHCALDEIFSAGILAGILGSHPAKVYQILVVSGTVISVSKSCVIGAISDPPFVFNDNVY
jgi:hypothetical protein